MQLAPVHGIYTRRMGIKCMCMQPNHTGPETASASIDAEMATRDKGDRGACPRGGGGARGAATESAEARGITRRRRSLAGPRELAEMRGCAGPMEVVDAVQACTAIGGDGAARAPAGARGGAGPMEAAEPCVGRLRRRRRDGAARAMQRRKNRGGGKPEKRIACDGISAPSNVPIQRII